jgi:hypothetical protein
MMSWSAPSILFIALGACRALSAGVPAWEEFGFREPIPASAMVTQGNRVFAGDDEGLRASRDSGKTWASVPSLPSSGPVQGLFAADGFLLAIRSGTFYRSPDSGSTWSPCEGKPHADPPYRFRRDGDSLFLLQNRYPPHARMLSLDQGRTWTTIATREWDPEPVLVEAEPGSLFRLGTDGLSESGDGGGTWKPCPWDTALGTIGTLDAAQGNLYVTTDRGICMRRGIRETEWHVLAPALHAAEALALAASGPSICVATALGVSCSPDGRDFTFLLAEPYSPATTDLAMDGDHVYLATTSPGYSSPIRHHPLATAAGPWGKIMDSTLTFPRIAARTGLLLVTKSQTLTHILYLSRDQGGSFGKLPPFAWDNVIPNGQYSPLVAAMGKERWVVAGIELGFYPWVRPDFDAFFLSGDSGRSYHRLPNSITRIKTIGISDSSLFGLDPYGFLFEFRFSDSAWSSLPSPSGGPASAMAATDSLLYVYSGGKLWRSNLNGSPVGIRAMRDKKRRKGYGRGGMADFVRPGRGPGRNALGRRIEGAQIKRSI